MAEVTDVDAERREVVLDRGERLGYDSLIVACGARDVLLRERRVGERLCGLKTLADAVDLRNRIYGAFEQAERAGRRASREEWLTFAVIGGGPTGVEVAGALATMAQHSKMRGFARSGPQRRAE